MLNTAFNKTNPIPAHQVSRPTPKMRNEPNFRRDLQSTNHELPTTNQIRETNPIPVPPLASSRPNHPRIMRNEPNLHPAAVLPCWPKVSPDLSGNPIYHTTGNLPRKPSPIMRNEPNLRTPGIIPALSFPRKRRIQKSRPTPEPRPKYAKQSQLPPRRTRY